MAPVRACRDRHPPRPPTSPPTSSPPPPPAQTAPAPLSRTSAPPAPCRSMFSSLRSCRANCAMPPQRSHGRGLPPRFQPADCHQEGAKKSGREGGQLGRGRHRPVRPNAHWVFRWHAKSVPQHKTTRKSIFRPLAGAYVQRTFAQCGIVLMADCAIFRSAGLPTGCALPAVVGRLANLPERFGRPQRQQAAVFGALNICGAFALRIQPIGR